MDFPSGPPVLDRPSTDKVAPSSVPKRRLSVRRRMWDRTRSTATDDGPAHQAGTVLGRVWNSAWPLLVLGNFFWASNIVIGRAILGHVPSVSLSFWRWTCAFFVALLFAWPHLKNDWPVLREHWKIMLALSATGIALFNIVAYIGLSGTTALNVLLLQSSLPLIVTIWAFALFRERPSSWQLAAVMISLAGVAFVAAHGSLEALINQRFYRSDLWIAASVVIYGVYIVLLRRRPPVHPLSFMQVAMGLGTLMVVPFYLWELSRGVTMTNHWQNFVGIGYMAVFPSFISYLLFNRGVQLIGAARAGQSTHLMPIFGSVMACLCLGEELHLYHLIGVILIGAGIILAQLKTPRQ
ncbi:MAG: DMT family transporter [Acetobacteraceae bacterium]|jgi:drug/metabolite transporter (DMT)-like permease